MQDGRVIATHVTEFQQLSADESYGLSASLSGFGLYEGIFMPAAASARPNRGITAWMFRSLRRSPIPKSPFNGR